MFAMKIVVASGLLVVATAGAVAIQAPQTPPAPAAQAEAPSGKPHMEVPDTESSTCLMCHEDIAKAEVVHAPVAEGMCTTCHEFSGAGESMRVALAGGTTDDTAPLCTMCHDDIAGLLKAPHVHGPAAEGGCTTCHSPHGSASKGLLTAPQAELCGMCHADVAEDLGKKTPHKPAAAACTLCHDPHGGPNPAQLRAEVNPLCLQCHSSTAPPPPPEGSPGKFFGQVVDVALVPLLSPNGLVTLDPLMRRNHPVVGHPVRGPKDPLNEERPFSCVSCHTPHGADNVELTRFGGPRGEFCVNCHK